MRNLACTVILALLATPACGTSENASAASGSSSDARLVGLWLGLQEGVEFPLGCESGETVRYSADGSYSGPGANGEWRLRNGQLTETLKWTEDGDGEAVGRTFANRIDWQGPDTFIKTFSERGRMTFRRCPEPRAAASAAKQKQQPHSQLAGVRDLVQQQISNACMGEAGRIDPAAVIASDLTADGKADLVISHEGIACPNGTRSSLCGAELCAVNIYRRKGELLQLEREMLGAQVTVSSGAVHMHALGGKPATIKWNGREFR